MLNIRKRIGLKIKDEIDLYRSLFKDPRTPRISKILIGAAVGYIFFPFDLIPDFIPVLGQLDEAIIIPLLIYIALKFIPQIVYEEHKNKLKQPIK